MALQAAQQVPAAGIGVVEIFPDSPRVIYAIRPLEEVICQLRFPPILRIETEAPADFQERIRTAFPLLERPSDPVLSQLPVDLPAEFAKLVQASTRQITYTFKTEDEKTAIILGPESIALSTKAYERWEGFSAHLHLALDVT